VKFISLLSVSLSIKADGPTGNSHSIQIAQMTIPLNLLLAFSEQAKILENILGTTLSGTLERKFLPLIIIIKNTF